MVLTSANNKTVRVGNGMTGEMKAYVLENKGEILGKLVEVKAKSVSGRNEEGGDEGAIDNNNRKITTLSCVCKF